MKTKYLIGLILLAVILGCGVFYLQFKSNFFNNVSDSKTNSSETNTNQASQSQTNQTNDNPYGDLRKVAFDLTPEDIGTKVNDDQQPFEALMELSYPDGIATLVAFNDGNACLYLSSGGSIIGGLDHENIRKASLSFILKTQEFVTYMKKTESYPMPQNGFVRFYLRTRGGTYTFEEDQRKLTSPQSQFKDVFESGRNLINELRKLAMK